MTAAIIAVPVKRMAIFFCSGVHLVSSWPCFWHLEVGEVGGRSASAVGAVVEPAMVWQSTEKFNECN
jgi:hypothetical protein